MDGGAGSVPAGMEGDATAVAVISGRAIGAGEEWKMSAPLSAGGSCRRPAEGMVVIAKLIQSRAVRPRERMNSPLENRKVRLRGLGGPAVCGVPGTCASAAVGEVYEPG
jgi:hypothetical protein